MRSALSKSCLRGFSIAELAIVFVAVGLLLAAAMKGIEIVAGSRIASTVIQTETTQMAANTFIKKFGYIPGDMRGASSRIEGCGADCEPVAADAGDTVVGDRNWASTNILESQVVGTTVPAAAGMTVGSETYLFWSHLAKAGMMNSVNANGAASGAAYAFGVTHPKAEVGGGFVIGHFSRDADSLGPVLAIVSEPRSAIVEPRVGGTVTAVASTSPQDPPLTAVVAAQIDRKLDDGIPNAGRVRAYGALTVCNTGAAYNENSTNKECGLIFGTEFALSVPDAPAGQPPQTVTPPGTEVPACAPRISVAVTAPAPLHANDWVKVKPTTYDFGFFQDPVNWTGAGTTATAEITVNTAAMFTSFKLNTGFDYVGYSTPSRLPAQITLNGTVIYGDINHGSINLAGTDELAGLLVDGANTFVFTMQGPAAVADSTLSNFKATYANCVVPAVVPPPPPPPPANIACNAGSSHTWSTVSWVSAGAPNWTMTNTTDSTATPIGTSGETVTGLTYNPSLSKYSCVDFCSADMVVNGITAVGSAGSASGITYSTAGTLYELSGKPCTASNVNQLAVVSYVSVFGMAGWGGGASIAYKCDGTEWVQIAFNAGIAAFPEYTGVGTAANGWTADPAPPGGGSWSRTYFKCPAASCFSSVYHCWDNYVVTGTPDCDTTPAAALGIDIVPHSTDADLQTAAIDADIACNSSADYYYASGISGAYSWECFNRRNDSSYLGNLADYTGMRHTYVSIGAACPPQPYCVADGDPGWMESPEGLPRNMKPGEVHSVAVGTTLLGLQGLGSANCTGYGGATCTYYGYHPVAGILEQMDGGTSSIIPAVIDPGAVPGRVVIHCSP